MLMRKMTKVLIQNQLRGGEERGSMEFFSVEVEGEEMRETRSFVLKKIKKENSNAAASSLEIGRFSLSFS